jgi:glutathione peroxidase
MSLLDIEVKKIDGSVATLRDYQGKVILIVNVASKCGLTPQYEGLEKIYQKYRERGLVVLGFPANDFGFQEPGTNAEIQSFCQLSYGVTFPMFEKIVVKGDGQHPLYGFLTQAVPVAYRNADSVLEAKLKEKGLLSGKPSDIMWNFEKFLLNRNGSPISRFAPNDPALITAIEAALFE